MNLLIKNAIIVTQNASRDVIEGNIFVEDGKITEVGHVHDSSGDVIDADGGIALPGLINTHTHVGMNALRGFLDDLNLNEFLQKTFALDRDRTSEDIASSAEGAIREMISGGTTTFLDLYYAEDIIAEVAAAHGMRAFLAWVILDDTLTTQNGSPLRNAEKFISEYAGRSPLIAPMAGCQGVYVCSDETLMRAADLAERKKVAIHMHLSETRHEVYSYLKNKGYRPVEYLEKINFFRPFVRTIAAHGAWLTRAEMKILGDRNVSISHCARSNMKLGSGIAPVPELMAAGVNVSLGTDSATTSNNLDMFEEMRTSSLLQKVIRWDASVMDAQSALDMATVSGARALGLEGIIGTIATGASADVIILDGSSPRIAGTSRNNAVNNIVYSAEAGDVKHTLIEGRVVMLDRRLINVHGTS